MRFLSVYFLGINNLDDTQSSTRIQYIKTGISVVNSHAVYIHSCMYNKGPDHPAHYTFILSALYYSQLNTPYAKPYFYMPFDWSFRYFGVFPVIRVFLVNEVTPSYGHGSEMILFFSMGHGKVIHFPIIIWFYKHFL